MLLDVNVLIYAHREDLPEHPTYAGWLEALLSSEIPYSVSDLVLSGFLRIVTSRRIFNEPSSLDTALAFAEQVRSQPNCAPVGPGPRHWSLFVQLCRQLGASGDKIPDAYHAALAIELGDEWISADRGFSRFPGLRWRHPIEGAGTA